MVEVLQKILREVFEMALKELYTPSNYGTMDGDIIRPLKDSIRLDLRIIFREIYGVLRSFSIDADSATHIIKSMPVNLIADYPQGLNYPPSPIDLDNGYIDNAYAPYTSLRSFNTNVLLPVELIDSGDGLEEAVKHLPVAELYASIQDVDTGDLWGSVQETITFSEYRGATYNSGYGSFARSFTNFSPNIVIPFPDLGDYALRFFLPFSFYCDPHVSMDMPDGKRGRMVAAKSFFNFSSYYSKLSVWRAPV